MDELEGEHTVEGKGERGWKGSQSEKNERLHGIDRSMDLLDGESVESE